MPLAVSREVRLPTDLSFGSRFGPRFQTDVVLLGDGTEQRNSRWAQARHHGDVHYSVKTVAQLQVLLAFFQARHGKAQAWRFKWHLDYQVTRMIFAAGDGVATTFPLKRQYYSGGVLYEQRIRKPVGVGYPVGNAYDSVSLFVNNVLVEHNVGYAIDYTTGLVTMDAPPGAGLLLAWTGEYDWPMRFDVDTLAESLQLVRGLSSSSGGGDPVATPTYCALLDANAVVWYFWVDSLGQLQRDTSPPVGDWSPVTFGTPPSWHEILDETSQPWWLVPDLLGQLQMDASSPGGSGLVFATQPLDGITLVGENGRTRYRVTGDSNQQVVILPVVAGQQAVFDGVGMAEPLPIIEVR